MLRQFGRAFWPGVALRKESVDRNVPFDVIRPAIDVALRKESVDRNTIVSAVLLMYSVALRKESVDRNSIELASFRACTSRSPQGERG